MTYRLSIAERIALTVALSSRNQRVLQALAGAGDFDTGRNCRPNWETLSKRTGLSRATIARSLAELQAGGWIVRTQRRYRHPNVYAIVLEQLATSATQAKVVARSAPPITLLGSQIETLSPPLPSQIETQGSLLPSQIETPPVRTERTATPSTYRDPSAPALRAPADAGLAAAEPKGESPLPPWEAFNRARQASRAGAADVRTDDRDHPELRSAGGCERPAGGDQAAAPDPGLHLRQRSDSPGAAGARPAGPSMGAAQAPLALGLVDVNGDVYDTPPPRPAPQWGQLADALRKGLERKSG